MIKFSEYTTLTPETIVGKLFSFRDSAHFLHLQTTSFAEHKALDETYTSILGVADDISEFLLGVQAPARFKSITIDNPMSYSTSATLALANEIFNFSVKLCKYGDERNLEELCNLGSEVQKIGVKLKYLSTLK